MFNSAPWPREQQEERARLRIFLEVLPFKPRGRRSHQTASRLSGVTANLSGDEALAVYRGACHTGIQSDLAPRLYIPSRCALRVPVSLRTGKIKLFLVTGCGT